MNIARINLAHGSLKVHADYIQTIRRISQRLGIKVAILMDLPGPKYRTGRLKGGQVVLRKGARLARDTIPAKSGDLIVITGGVPIGVAGSTNLLKVEQIN